jgi:hypothetical protein
MKFRHLAAPLFLACLSPMAFAATDGTLGATSTGDTDVTITIGDVVQVRVQTDVGLSYTPGVDSTGSTGVCVYRNSDDDVNVTLTSTNPDGSDNFRMDDGGTNFVTYSVDFTGSTTNVTGAVSGAANTITDENNTASDCGGGFSHTLGVTATAVSLDAAPAGSYADTITILAEPI